jgi:nucleoside-diphosphate kinase
VRNEVAAVKQRTVVLVKPDGVRRRLVGEVIRRLDAKLLDIVDAKMVHIDKELASRHYDEHKE